jgi:hypothetical protein
MVILLMPGIAVAGVPITQITLGPSQSGDAVVFTNTGSGTQISITGTLPGGGVGLTGNGYVETVGTQGTYTFALSGTPTLGSPTNNVYPVLMNGSTLTFEYYVGSSWSTSTNEFGGTVTLTTVSDGSATPQLDAILTVTSSSGIFSSEWPTGQTSNMDFTVNLCPTSGTCGTPPSNYTSIDSVYLSEGGSTSGFLSSGELLPSPVPEPAGIALLGSGLILTGSLVKTRWRK